MRIGHIIKFLIDDVKIKEAELARQTGITQTTLNRLINDPNADPKISTLKPIADFFGISVSQLIGEEEIKNRIPGTFHITNSAAWSTLPVIAWEDIDNFIEHKISDEHCKSWVGTEKLISENSFGLHARAFMEPRFRQNSILLVDPKSKIKDGSFVVVRLGEKDITVREVLNDGQNFYLKHFDANFPHIKYNKKQHRILGAIVEARLDV